MTDELVEMLGEPGEMLGEPGEFLGEPGEFLGEPAIYAWPQSAVAGERVELFAAGPARVAAKVSVTRIGVRRETVWRGDIELEPHTLAPNGRTATHGCDWPAAAELVIDPEWRSGYYEVVLRSDAGRSAHEAIGFFVVRNATADPRRPLIALATNTWNAYNDFGGRNLYENGTHVSFRRPMAKGLLRKPDGLGSRVTVINAPDRGNRAHVRYLRDHHFTQWAGSAGWPNYELPFIQWAERNGYELDYALNADLEDQNALAGRSLYLSVGHDEYWSAPMRDTVEAFTKGGGNALFLSGNTAFWQVRLEDDASTMIGYKGLFKRDPVFGTDRQATLTSMWSDHLLERPENHMTGVSFVRGGYHRIGNVVASGAGGYTVYEYDHWVFAGTGVTYGDLIGSESIIVGYECDGCDFVMRNGMPSPTMLDGTPANFRILGLAPAQHFNRTNAPRPPADDIPSEVEYIASRAFGSHDQEFIDAIDHGHSVMGIHEPGGFVFTSGSTDWAWGLTGNSPIVEQITNNLMQRALS